VVKLSDQSTFHPEYAGGVVALAALPLNVVVDFEADALALAVARDAVDA
jgi:hypothetical protein